MLCNAIVKEWNVVKHGSDYCMQIIIHTANQSSAFCKCDGNYAICQ